MSEISIIVPVYNVDQYLENCIESILNQTFKDYELILIDDGSTDKSGEICDKYEKKDNRIKVIHKYNGGLSSARNAGLDLACGKYIGFVDSDDSIHPRMYETLYSLIKKYKADISCCNYKKIYNWNDCRTEKQCIEEVKVMDNIQAIRSLLDSDIGVQLVIAWNKLYKRNLFTNIRYDVGRIHEDEFIAHKLLYKSKKIIYTDSQLYYYFQRKGSIMSQKTDKSKVDRVLAFSDRLKFCYELGLEDICNKIADVYVPYFCESYYKLKESTKQKNIYENTLKDNFRSNFHILLKLKQKKLK